MKFLKWLLIVVVSLLVIFLVVALFLPSEYRVERSITIEAPPSEVYPLVADLHNWEYWSPWREREPSALYEFSGAEAGVGQIMSWKGEVVGEGSLTVVEMTEPEMIKSRLVFKVPMEAESDDIWTFEPDAGGTRVTWAEEGELGYPIGRYFGLGMDDMLGEDMEQGLETLKTYVETMPDEIPVLIDGAVPEDQVDTTALRPGEKEVGNPDVRYEHKPYEEAVKEAEERKARRLEEPLPDADPGKK